jgi:hypothetical protein
MLTRFTQLRAAGLFSVAGTVVAACLLGAAGPAREPVAAAAMPMDQMPTVACVLGFSKDYCNGQVFPGLQTILGCPTAPAPCRTLQINGATFLINVFANNQVCGSTITSTCDETVNGRFKVDSNFTIRLHQSCPYRGCWDGKFAEFTGDDGTVYQGTLMGTIGVGTHRPSTAPSICATPPSTRNCERCYDVSFDSANNRWRIGFEAAFHGKRADADTGEELCFTLSGDFYIPGDALSGPSWGSIWSVNGTADGIRFAACP